MTGLAVDFSAHDLAALRDQVDAILTYHGLSYHLIYETWNNCVHVEYPRRTGDGKTRAAKSKVAKPKAAATKSGPAGFPPRELSADDERFRLPEALGVTRHALGTKGSEEMLVYVSRSALPPGTSSRPHNRRFRVVLFAHGNMSDKWTPYYRTADAVFVKKSFMALVDRMNAAGHNVAFGVLCDQLNAKGNRYKHMKASSYFLEAVDLARRETLARHPDAVFEGITLAVHSGGGALAQAWLASPAVRAQLREEDGEVVYLDAYYVTKKGDARVLDFVAEGGLATLVAYRHTADVPGNCARLASKAGCVEETPDRKVNPPRTIVVIEQSTHNHQRASIEWDPFLPHLFKSPADAAVFYAPERRPMRAVDPAPGGEGVEHTDCGWDDDHGAEDDPFAAHRDAGPYLGDEDPSTDGALDEDDASTPA
jgi:hypothetical protein